MHHITSQLAPKTPNKRIDVIVGLDARGFLIGPTIALRLGAAFVPVRKKGKMPGKCVEAVYQKEYGAVSPKKFRGGVSELTVVSFQGYLRDAG